MTRTTIEGALRRRLQQGEHGIDYVVDARAVAEAMIASGVFVTLQTGNVVAVLVEQHEPGADRDVA
jgi:hypothetical protein